MATAIPRKCFLYVHDALRKLLGPEAHLAAFVTQRKPFQCDMLVNHARTDPENVKTDKHFVSHLASDLQRLLAVCTLEPFTRRIDISFHTGDVIQLALGAPTSRLNDIMTPAAINAEPDWRQRNRLRISMGYDEELFLLSCTATINGAAVLLEKRAYDHYKNSVLLELTQPTIAALLRTDPAAALPPLSYWQAHCYSYLRQYTVDHSFELFNAVSANYARYYGDYPMSNPYCEGEDLNTILAVQELCRTRRPLGMESGGTVEVNWSSQAPRGGAGPRTSLRVEGDADSLRSASSLGGEGSPIVSTPHD